MINDFVLKTMNHQTTTLDLKAFNHGILMGMYERIFAENGFDTLKLEERK
jgi:hypothetical protein